MAASGGLAGSSLIAVSLFDAIMLPPRFSRALEGQGARTPQASGVLCMAIVAGTLTMLLTGSAEAQPLRDERAPETNASTRPADTQRPNPAPTTTFSDQWPIGRNWLRARGVDIAAGYVSEAAGNVAGGARERARETGQFTLGATLDMERLVGLRGGKLQATATYRRGADLGAAADLGVLQQVQEVYGRGQTLRLTQLWYQQSLDGEHVDIKLGRLTMGEDTAAFSCQFMNLSFCGSPPGNLVGDYWYNWPVSQWAARARVHDARFYATAGIYESNPRNLDNVFALGYFHGAKGVILPGEVGFTPRVGARGLPGAYKYGAWYNTANADDVELDVNRGRRAVTGLAPLRRDGRYGFFLQIQQQLTGEAAAGPQGPRTKRGLVAFANYTQTDPQTSRVDSQLAFGVFYTGLFDARLDDDFGFAFARTHVNARAVSAIPAGKTERPDSEYATEIFYGVHVVSWLILRPNVQLVVDPGGYGNADAVVILGMKSAVTF